MIHGASVSLSGAGATSPGDAPEGVELLVAARRGEEGGARFRCIPAAAPTVPSPLLRGGGSALGNEPGGQCPSGLVLQHEIGPEKHHRQFVVCGRDEEN